MPATIQTIVSDPDFGKLSAADQATVVGHFDPDFSSVPDAEKGAVIEHLQRQAIARPDLAPPPGGARPEANMEQWGGTPSPTAGLPGSSPNPYSAGPVYTGIVGGATAGAAGYAALAGTPLGYAAGYATEAIKAMVKAHPFAAKVLLGLAGGKAAQPYIRDAVRAYLGIGQ